MRSYVSWKIRNFIGVSIFRNIRIFLILEPESSIPKNIKYFLGVDFFIFPSLETYFLEYKKFLEGFRFLKYKKSFLLKKYKKILNIRARRFQFAKHKKFFSGWIFFIFSSLGSKSAPGCSMLYCCSIVYFWLGSKFWVQVSTMTLIEGWTVIIPEYPEKRP